MSFEIDSDGDDDALGLEPFSDFFAANDASSSLSVSGRRKRHAHGNTDGDSGTLDARFDVEPATPMLDTIDDDVADKLKQLKELRSTSLATSKLTPLSPNALLSSPDSNSTMMMSPMASEGSFVDLAALEIGPLSVFLKQYIKDLAAAERVSKALMDRLGTEDSGLERESAIQARKSLVDALLALGDGEQEGQVAQRNSIFCNIFACLTTIYDNSQIIIPYTEVSITLRFLDKAKKTEENGIAVVGAAMQLASQYATAAVLSGAQKVDFAKTLLQCLHDCTPEELALNKETESDDCTTLSCHALTETLRGLESLMLEETVLEQLAVPDLNHFVNFSKTITERISSTNSELRRRRVSVSTLSSAAISLLKTYTVVLNVVTAEETVQEKLSASEQFSHDTAEALFSTLQYLFNIKTQEHRRASSVSGSTINLLKLLPPSLLDAEKAAIAATLICCVSFDSDPLSNVHLERGNSCGTFTSLGSRRKSVSFRCFPGNNDSEVGSNGVAPNVAQHVVPFMGSRRAARYLAAKCRTDHAITNTLGALRNVTHCADQNLALVQILLDMGVVTLLEGMMGSPIVQHSCAEICCSLIHILANSAFTESPICLTSVFDTMEKRKEDSGFVSEAIPLLFGVVRRGERQASIRRASLAVQEEGDGREGWRLLHEEHPRVVAVLCNVFDASERAGVGAACGSAIQHCVATPAGVTTLLENDSIRHIIQALSTPSLRTTCLSILQTVTHDVGLDRAELLCNHAFTDSVLSCLTTSEANLACLTLLNNIALSGVKFHECEKKLHILFELLKGSEVNEKRLALVLLADLMVCSEEVRRSCAENFRVMEFVVRFMSVSAESRVASGYAFAALSMSKNFCPEIVENGGINAIIAASKSPLSHIISLKRKHLCLEQVSYLQQNFDPKRKERIETLEAEKLALKKKNGALRAALRQALVTADPVEVVLADNEVGDEFPADFAEKMWYSRICVSAVVALLSGVLIEREPTAEPRKEDKLMAAKIAATEAESARADEAVAETAKAIKAKADAEAKSTHLETELTTMQTTVDTLRTELSTLTSHTTTLTEQLAAERTHNADLTTHTTQHETALLTLTDEITALKNTALQSNLHHETVLAEETASKTKIIAKARKYKRALQETTAKVETLTERLEEGGAVQNTLRKEQEYLREKALRVEKERTALAAAPEAPVGHATQALLQRALEAESEVQHIKSVHSANTDALAEVHFYKQKLQSSLDVIASLNEEVATLSAAHQKQQQQQQQPRPQEDTSAADIIEATRRSLVNREQNIQRREALLSKREHEMSQETKESEEEVRTEFTGIVCSQRAKKLDKETRLLSETLKSHGKENKREDTPMRAHIDVFLACPFSKGGQIRFDAPFVTQLRAWWVNAASSFAVIYERHLVKRHKELMDTLSRTPALKQEAPDNAEGGAVRKTTVKAPSPPRPSPYSAGPGGSGKGKRVSRVFA